MTVVGLMIAILASAAVLVCLGVLAISTYLAPDRSERRGVLLGASAWAAAALLVIWSVWAAWQ